MPSVPPSPARERVVTSDNVVRLTAVVITGVSVVGLSVYSIHKTGSTEALTGLVEAGRALSWLHVALG